MDKALVKSPNFSSFRQISSKLQILHKTAAPAVLKLHT